MRGALSAHRSVIRGHLMVLSAVSLYAVSQLGATQNKPQLWSSTRKQEPHTIHFTHMCANAFNSSYQDHFQFCLFIYVSMTRRWWRGQLLDISIQRVLTEILPAGTVLRPLHVSQSPVGVAAQTIHSYIFPTRSWIRERQCQVSDWINRSSGPLSVYYSSGVVS